MITNKPLHSKYARLLLLAGAVWLLTMCQNGENRYSRGVGIYPGAGNEYFGPVRGEENTSYRNLAYLRPAFHSSSYDYNLTAQLATDGVITDRLPAWYEASSSSVGTLPRNEREYLIDHNAVTTVRVEGPEGWIQIGLRGSGFIPSVDSLSFHANLMLDDRSAQGWSISVKGSKDGQSWEELGQFEATDYPGDTLPRRSSLAALVNRRALNQTIPVVSPSSLQFLRLEFQAPNVTRWDIGSLELYSRNRWVELAPSHKFTSAWMSQGRREEWLYVDLGASCSFDLVKLYWINRATKGALQVSEDGAEWKTLAEWTERKDENVDEFLIEPEAQGRFVRLLLQNPAGQRHYILSEVEVFGRGGFSLKPRPMPKPVSKTRMDLAGGNWTLQRASLVTAQGEAISTGDFAADDWIIATVPGTVLTSYLNIGAVPDPNYGDNQLQVSESFFYSDFWYRNEFEVPSSFAKDRIFLNFDGINWKAQVYCNGRSVGRIEGAFTRGVFDITGDIRPGKKNVIAVRVEKNATPGAVKEQTAQSPDKNGGALGADNPTFHASIGWDWIPTIRGRNTGIWNDVYLTATGPVTLKDPFVNTQLPLPETNAAEVSIEVTLQNHSNENQEGILKGKLGDIAIEQQVSLAGAETKIVQFSADQYPQLHLENPRLWWPNGYGDPNLYDVELIFQLSDRTVSDKKTFKTGLRQITYVDEEEALKIYVNGKRFVGRGGNWGFSESMLRYRGREYDVAVRYHRDMNCTLIRNWVGQIGDDEFYEACDRHGLMIWQDFWLANPVDGPNPDDPGMFMDNAQDFVRRIRNHPSLVLYCGRNEGNPPRVLDESIRKLVREVHPGLPYISHSAVGPVSGFGPYHAMPAKFYFEERATVKLHSELGMANIVSLESLQDMMPDSAQWPIGRMWGIHDFCASGAQNGASYRKLMGINFGEPEQLEEWITLAQFRNYEGYRAMFEAQSRNRMGLVIWMSHPAWPSFVWQTYDYYFEPTAAYFGIKKASEPLHIQWNAATDSVEVVNYSAPARPNLTAQLEIFDLNGRRQWQMDTTVNTVTDSRINCFKIEKPAEMDSVYFIRLKLLSEEEVLSENFYWRGPVSEEPLGDFSLWRNLKDNDYKALLKLPEVAVESSTRMTQIGNRWLLTTKLKNSSDHPALMIRLQVVRGKSGKRILPVIYSDNYVSLMPGEEKTIEMDFADADTQGENPEVRISGFHVAGQKK